MIKLKCANPPTYLSYQKKQDLTDKYKTHGTNVWNKKEIKDALLRISHDKCAYCECEIGSAAGYLEVEHFIAKSIDPDKVLEWENLLPSCKSCNGKKGSHDVIAEPIINPYKDEPKDHLSFIHARLKYRSLKGKTTIHVVDLNNTKKKVQPRMKVLDATSEKLLVLWELFEIYQAEKTSLNKSRLKNSVAELLDYCLPNNPYSACLASSLLNQQHFFELVRSMQKLDLWDGEHEKILDELNTIKLS